MLDGCNDIEKDLQEVFIKAAGQACRLDNSRVGTEHLLLALAQSGQNIAAQALDSMKITFDILEIEIKKLINEKNFADCELSHNDLPGNVFLSQLCFNNRKSKQIPFSDEVIKTLAKADDLAHYLGQGQIGVGHILWAIAARKNSCAATIFEELSINIAFLKGKIMHFMAIEYLQSGQRISLRSVLVSGLKGLIEKHSSALCLMQELINKSKMEGTHLPKKEQIIQAVCTAYLAECLFNQIAFQRYLLEEALATLSQTVGSLSDEIASQIVSTTAQHLRKQVRQSIEYIWTDEYKLIRYMLNDAEHDLIGSVIEDLWWAYSEDIALDKSFTSALEDHRKAHLLDLQSRRVELSKRLRKLKNRLEDTIRQCFQDKVK